MKSLVTEKLIVTRILNLALHKSIGQGPTLKDVPIPTISGTEIQVKVTAVALNPVDYKFADSISPSGSRLGCDFAGVVSAVGNQAAGNWKVGDRVAGMVFGGIYQDQGAFAEYLKTDGDLVWKIPDNVSNEEASTFGVAAVTAMLTLNVNFEIPWPESVTKDGITPSKSFEHKQVLIYSGATTVGLFAIQLAKLAGCTVITTASPHSFDLVKRYGADDVYNYRSPTALQEIKSKYPNITAVLDCISKEDSGHFCAQILQNNGTKVYTLEPLKSKTKGIDFEMIMVFTVFGTKFAFLPPVRPTYEATPQHRQALVHFYSILSSLTQDKKLQAPPITALDGGFDGILKAMDLLRAGKISGSKTVVPLGTK
jgi:NADPH:quinone reductase-like Zn-dependent oxidoreductase